MPVRRSVWILLLLALAAVVLPACTQDTEDAAGDESAVSRQAFDALERSLSHANDARKDRDGTRERLGAELSGVFLALTPQEVSAYSTSFHKRAENVRVREAYEASLRELADALTAGSRGERHVKGDLVGFAKERIEKDWFRTSWNLSVRGTRSIYQSAVLLASSDEIDDDAVVSATLEFAGHVLRDDTFTFTREDGSQGTGRYREIAARGAEVREDALDAKIEQEIVVPAIVNHAIAYLTSAQERSAGFRPSSVDVGMILRPLAMVPDVLDGAVSAKQAVDRLLGAQGAQLPAATQALLVSRGKFVTGLVAVSVIANLWMAGDALVEGDYLAAIKNVVHAIPYGVQLLASVAKYSNTRLVNAAMLGRLSARLAPLAGLALAAIETYELWKRFEDDANLGTGISLGGGLLTCVGFGMMLFPPLAGAGAVVVAVSAVVRVLGEWVAGRIEAAVIREQVRRTLGQLGLEQSVVETLLAASNGRLSELHDELKLGPDAMKTVARRYPRLVTQGAIPVASLSDMTKTFTEEPTPAPAFDAVALMAAIDAEGGTDDELLRFCVSTVPGLFTGYPSTNDTSSSRQLRWVAALDGATGFSPTTLASMKRAAAYLRPLAH